MEVAIGVAAETGDHLVIGDRRAHPIAELLEADPAIDEAHRDEQADRLGRLVPVQPDQVAEPLRGLLGIAVRRRATEPS